MKRDTIWFTVEEAHVAARLFPGTPVKQAIEGLRNLIAAFWAQVE